MALPAGFLEELRARTPLPALIGRKVRLIRSGRHHKGCCPFHGEKTPSFYVYDDGFHCFGCGAHGDGISFVMQSEGVEFMDAVRRLAGEAGLEVPAPSPQAAAAERRRLDVHAVLACADGVFRRLLMGSEGARGLAYLRERALTADTIAQAGLGWAPGGRALLAALEAEGVTAAQAVEAGLAQDGEHGVRALFFERVVFPIRDPRGRVISFGGRTLGDGQPKYLNGPETAVFSKRRGLYGLDRARVAVRDGAALVVVEGYMDVLRLQQAGFGGAVAPLGTALTGEQLELLWRVSDAPILCFDGDAAGGRATGRAMELALPLLSSDKLLKVALMPTGEDPDSLIGKGVARFRAILEAANATSFAEHLYRHAKQISPGNDVDSRAQLHKNLVNLAASIKDKVFSQEYRYSLVRLFFQKNRSGAYTEKNNQYNIKPARSAIDVREERIRNLFALLLNHPDFIHDVEQAFVQVDLGPQLSRMRSEISEWARTTAGALESADLVDHLAQVDLSELISSALSDKPLPCGLDRKAMPAEALERWWHFYEFLNIGALDREVVEAQERFQKTWSDVDHQRFKALARVRLRVLSGDADGDVFS